MDPFWWRFTKWSHCCFSLRRAACVVQQPNQQHIIHDLVRFGGPARLRGAIEDAVAKEMIDQLQPWSWRWPPIGCFYVAVLLDQLQQGARPAEGFELRVEIPSTCASVAEILLVDAINEEIGVD